MKFLLSFFLLFSLFSRAQTPPPPEVSDKAPAEEEDINKIPTWNCRVDSQPAEGAFTVGEKFVLLCEGQAVSFGDSKKVHFQMPEALLYVIKVLSVDRLKSNEVILTATSYLKGQHKLQELVLVQDLEEKFNVRPFQLNIKSVIDNPEQKPYPPMGAVMMAYPFWFWFSGTSIFIIALCYGIFRLQRRAKRLKVLEELKRHNTALGPYNQLNKDLRTLTRRYSFSVKKKWDPILIERYVVSLDEIFRMYLLREFIVPALDWRTNLVVKEINKTDKKRFSSYGISLRKFLKELDRARKDIDKVDKEDCVQLTQMARKVSQTIWQQRRMRGAR